jgi:hypothetical protein
MNYDHAVNLQEDILHATTWYRVTLLPYTSGVAGSREWALIIEHLSTGSACLVRTVDDLRLMALLGERIAVASPLPHLLERAV